MDFIEKDLEDLKKGREKYDHNVVGGHLSAYVAKVPDISDKLNDIAVQSKTQKAVETRFCEEVSAVIVEAADGNITVTEYVQKQMSKQVVYLYVGTHWRSIRTQQFYDFVKDGAYAAGLDQKYAENPRFMNTLFEAVAFRVSRDREQYVPNGEVWINMQNGTLEVMQDGSLNFRQHVREDFFTYVLPYGYQPEAQCPRWHKFLDEVLPEKESQLLLGEYLGYCFTRNLKLEKCLVMYGGGQNGKSVTTDVACELFGYKNVSHIDLEMLTTNETYRAEAVGKLANISQENGPNVQYSTLKNMVSGETVMVRNLYKDPYPTSNYGKIIASYNTLPKTENTFGFYRRWLLLPFNVTISKEQMDVNLKAKLCEELSGILNWVLECLQGLVVRKGFTESKVCEEALDEYKLNCNSALRYFYERCVLDEDSRLKLKDLYADYLRFCNEDNISNRFGKNNFMQQLKNVGVGKRTYAGINYLNVKLRGE